MRFPSAMLAAAALGVMASHRWSAAQATRPASAPAVAETPKAALRELSVALREGDGATIRRVFLASTPAERRMAEADAQIASALAELRRAAVAAFGPEAANTVTGDTAAGAAESLARIEAADVKVDGDTATVTYRDEREGPFVLKKSDGEWRIPIAQLGKPLDAAALEQRLTELSLQTNVVREVARMIHEGKFASAEQAREAWQNRILQAATSQPVKTTPRLTPDKP